MSLSRSAPVRPPIRLEIAGVYETTLQPDELAYRFLEAVIRKRMALNKTGEVFTHGVAEVSWSPRRPDALMKLRPEMNDDELNAWPERPICAEKTG